MPEAVEAARKAVACAPRDSHHVSHLGWTLAEAGQYAEARVYLHKAVKRAPPGYTTHQNNLAELENRARHET